MTSRIVCHPDPVVKPQLQCPYNPAHFLYEERFQRHLVTCGQSHPEVASKMTTCRFNQTHIILKSKIKAHEETCNDRRIVVPSAVAEVILPNKSRQLGSIATADEDWETEVNHVSYDPTQRTAQLEIAPVPSGLKPSDRKAFRNQARIVLGNNTGNLPEGANVEEALKPMGRLPYQPSGGRGKAVKQLAATQEIGQSVKILTVDHVPKPKSKIAASFSAPPTRPTSIGRGRLAADYNGYGDDDDFPSLGAPTGRGRPIRPPPGFEPPATKMSGLTL